jgi:hypothetical protein
MTSIGSSSTFTDTSAAGPVRNFNTRGSADLVVVFETGAASNTAAGARIKDPADPTKDLACIGPASHGATITDAAPWVRAVVLQGTATAIWMDAAALPATGPAGPAGGARHPVATKTANFTAAANDLVPCDPSGGAFAVTLPAAASVSAGAEIVVKNVTTSTTAITIARTGSDTIDGGTSATMSNSKGVTYWISDGVSNWMKG